MDKIIAVIVSALFIFFIATVIGLFFIKLGWSLFMVPVFGMAELSWMQALGLSLLAGAFKSYNTTKNDK